MLDIQLQLALLLALFEPGVLLALKVAFCAIVGDAVITWILAIAKGEFQGGLVLKFIKTSLLPYIGTLFLLALLTLADENYKPVFYAISTLVTAAFGYEALKDKLLQYFKPANEPPSLV